MTLQFEIMRQRHFPDHATWISWLHDLLPRPKLQSDAPAVLDLFAGCGGLALGFEAHGFRTVGYEMKPVAVSTYNKNLRAYSLDAHTYYI